MFLCHKCSGLLVHDESENVAGLHGCRCMSGYYRGFELKLDRAQAIEAQIKRTEERIKMYERQERDAQYLEPEREWLRKLEELKKEN
jgi:hypothetical protein